MKLYSFELHIPHHTAPAGTFTIKTDKMDNLFWKTLDTKLAEIVDNNTFLDYSKNYPNRERLTTKIFKDLTSSEELEFPLSTGCDDFMLIVDVEDWVQALNGITYTHELIVRNGNGQLVICSLPNRITDMRRTDLISYFYSQCPSMQSRLTKLEREYAISILLNELELPLSKPFEHSDCGLYVAVYIHTKQQRGDQ